MAFWKTFKNQLCCMVLISNAHATENNIRKLIKDYHGLI